jgi:hypothetical protein
MNRSLAPRLGLAVLTSVTVAWLLLTLLRSQPDDPASKSYSPPAMYDAPYRGDSRAAH